MLVGGARSGKTFLLCRAVFIRAIRSAGSRHAIFRYRYNAVRRSIWLDTLPKVRQLCFPGLEVKAHEQDGYLVLPNKSEVWVGGLDDKERVDKLLGQEYSTEYYNEISQIPFLSVTTALTRLAQKSPGLVNRAYYDLNPVGTGHWSYQLFVQHRAPGTSEALANPDDYRYASINPVDNLANIDPGFLESLRSLPERQWARFLEGRYVAQLDGALWTLELIESTRIAPEDLPPLRRVVIAVDPSGARGEFDLKADEIGIVAVGESASHDVYLLEDRTGLYSPEQWGRVACEMFQRHKADRVIAERNFGGDMVRAVIAGADRQLAEEHRRTSPFPYTPVAYKEISASRGKSVRAEPIAAAYERGKVHHVGRFPALEEELANFTTAGYRGSGSPNRADALVHGVTELLGQGGAVQLFTAESLTLSGDVPKIPLDRPSPWRIGRPAARW